MDNFVQITIFCRATLHQIYHGIDWENSEQTKLTMEPRPKTKEQRHLWSN